MDWDEILDRISAGLAGGMRGYSTGHSITADIADRKQRAAEHTARMGEVQLNRQRLETADRERAEDRELELIRRGFRRGAAPSAILPDTSAVPGPATGVGRVPEDDRYHQVRNDLYLDRHQTPEYLAHQDRVAAELGRNERADESRALRDMISQRDWQHRGEMQEQRMAEAYRRMTDAISMNFNNRQDDPSRATDQVLRAAQMLMAQDEDLDFNSALQRATESLASTHSFRAPTPGNPAGNRPIGTNRGIDIAALGRHGMGHKPNETDQAAEAAAQYVQSRGGVQATPAPNLANEKALALAAIDAGQDPEKVRAQYRRRTGQRPDF